MLGTDIRRFTSRHYMGRVFATMASIALKLPVYDTQCGAKAFRRSKTLESALARPFLSRWAFDVELIGRLLKGTPTDSGIPESAFVEVPLRTWHDIPGCHYGIRDLVRMSFDVLRIGREVRRDQRTPDKRGGVS
jgi:hypothetical protein